MKTETNEPTTPTKRGKEDSVTPSSKNKAEGIAVQLRTPQKQQGRGVAIGTGVGEAKKNVEQYSPHPKSKLERERLARMTEDEKTIMRARNADRAARSYAISKLKASSEYRNMTEEEKKLSVEETQGRNRGGSHGGEEKTRSRSGQGE